MFPFELKQAIRRHSSLAVFVLALTTGAADLIFSAAGAKVNIFIATAPIAIILGLGTTLIVQFQHRNQLERSLEERERRYQLLAENVADILVVLGLDGRFRYVSRSVGTLLGMPEENFLGRSCLDLMHDEDRATVLAATSGITRSTEARSVRFRTRRKDGAFVWLEANFKLALNPENGDREIVGALRDVTRQKALEDELSSSNQRLAQLASTDGLTGLSNRRQFDITLREAYAGHSVLSLLLIDIDYFKAFNDSFGHQAGDDCLRRIAVEIGRIVKDRDDALAARYGGEEFAIILPSTFGDEALRTAEALRILVRRLDISHPVASEGYVTISVGVSSRSPITTGAAPLLRDADLALYRAKAEGRNCCIASMTEARCDRRRERVASL